MEQLINALPSLLKKQQELDDYIMRERGLTHDETIEQRKLAFVVELAELAQEWRGFKYWSDNQEPSEKMLEEYVDVLHFALSLHNYHEHTVENTAYQLGLRNEYTNERETPLTVAFLEVLLVATYTNVCEGELLANTLILGDWLGLRADDILKEYDRKYQINIERQNNGY